MCAGGGGSLAAGVTSLASLGSSPGGHSSSSSSREQDRCQPSVKKEPLESLRERQGGRYSPEFGYQHRLSPHHPSYHGYHVDKSLLPPSLSGPHAATELHGQKFDFFRAQNSESDSVRGLQSHGLC